MLLCGSDQALCVMSATNTTSPTKAVLWIGLLWDAVCLSGNAYHFSPLKMPFANFSQHTLPPHAQNRDHKLQINEKSEHAHLCPTMNSLSGSTHPASFIREHFVLACLSLFWCFLTLNLFLVKSGVVGWLGEKKVSLWFLMVTRVGKVQFVSKKLKWTAASKSSVGPNTQYFLLHTIWISVSKNLLVDRWEVECGESVNTVPGIQPPPASSFSLAFYFSKQALNTIKMSMRSSRSHHF